MDEAKIRKTPMSSGYVMKKRTEDEKECTLKYRGVVGCLMYPMLWTRPDLAFVTGSLGQASSDPSMEHWNRAMDVLRYIRGSLDLNLVYKKSENFELVGYADSDWAADKRTGKSVYGYAFYIGGNIVSWKSKKSQTTTATSSTVAELEALYHATVEGIWLNGLLMSLGLSKEKKMLIYQDNQAVIAIVQSDKYLDRTKHEVVKVEFIRDQIREGILSVEFKGTEEMIADIFTKSLGKNLFEKHLSQLNLERRKIKNEGEC